MSNTRRFRWHVVVVIVLTRFPQFSIMSCRKWTAKPVTCTARACFLTGNGLYCSSVQPDTETSHHIFIFCLSFGGFFRLFFFFFFFTLFYSKFYFAFAPSYCFPDKLCNIVYRHASLITIFNGLWKYKLTFAARNKNWGSGKKNYSLWEMLGSNIKHVLLQYQSVFYFFSKCVFNLEHKIYKHVESTRNFN